MDMSTVQYIGYLMILYVRVCEWSVMFVDMWVGDGCGRVE